MHKRKLDAARLEAESWKKQCILLNSVAEQTIQHMEKDIATAQEKLVELRTELESANETLAHQAEHQHAISADGDLKAKSKSNKYARVSKSRMKRESRFLYKNCYFEQNFFLGFMKNL